MLWFQLQKLSDVLAQSRSQPLFSWWFNNKKGCINYEYNHKKKSFIYSEFRFFVCVEVLRPSQPNGIMSSAVSLPNHTFTGQASSSIVHILSPEIRIQVNTLFTTLYSWRGGMWGGGSEIMMKFVMLNVEQVTQLASVSSVKTTPHPTPISGHLIVSCKIITFMCCFAWNVYACCCHFLTFCISTLFDIPQDCICTT